MTIADIIFFASQGTADGSPPPDSTTMMIIDVLVAAGIGAVLAAIVSGFFSKKKLGAEATEIITKAAAGVVTQLEAEVVRGRKDREALRDEHTHEMRQLHTEMADMAQAHVEEREEWKRVLQLHVAWDAVAIAKLGELGFELPPAPPLLPPSRYTDEKGYPR